MRAPEVIIQSHTNLSGLSDDDHIAYGWRPYVKESKVSSTQHLGIPGIETGASITTAASANILRYSPLFVENSITVDAFYLEVTSAAGAGEVARLGIYNADTNWQPTTLVLDAGTVAIDSTGVKSTSVTLTLSAGRYLAAINCNGNVTVRTYRGGSRYGGVHDTFGASAIVVFWTKSQTYESFPSTGRVWDTITGSTTGVAYYFLLRTTAV